MSPIGIARAHNGDWTRENASNEKLIVILKRTIGIEGLVCHGFRLAPLSPYPLDPGRAARQIPSGPLRERVSRLALLGSQGEFSSLFWEEHVSRDRVGTEEESVGEEEKFHGNHPCCCVVYVNFVCPAKKEGFRSCLFMSETLK